MINVVIHAYRNERVIGTPTPSERINVTVPANQYLNNTFCRERDINKGINSNIWY